MRAWKGVPGAENSLWKAKGLLQESGRIGHHQALSVLSGCRNTLLGSGLGPSNCSLFSYETGQKEVWDSQCRSQGGPWFFLAVRQ